MRSCGASVRACLRAGMPARMHAQAGRSGSMLLRKACRVRPCMLQDLVRAHLPPETHFLPAQMCHLLSVNR